MKKINTTKLMALLASACLITSSFVGSTLAKYTTTANADDTARVAKWGVVLQADGSLYGTNYGTGANSVPTTDDTVANLSVKAAANAVAPGTENKDGLSFAVLGVPEVRTQLTVTIAEENIYLKQGTYAVMVSAPEVTETSFKENTYYTEASGVYTLADIFVANTPYFTMRDKVELTHDYYPVVYNADKTYTEADGVKVNTIKEIAADYITKLGGTSATSTTLDGKTTSTFSVTYDPNFNYSDLDVARDNLTWAWKFENGTTDVEKAMYNGADTILGNLIAEKKNSMPSTGEVVKVGTTIEAPTEATGTAYNDFNLDTNFSLDIRVEQVD